MKNTIKLFTILFIIAFLLLGYSTVAKAVENQYLTIDNVSSEVGQKAKVEIKAKTDLIVDDINLEISYDDTKLSVSTSDIKVNDMLTNDSDKGIKKGVIVLGFSKAEPITIKANTTILAIDFTVQSKGTTQIKTNFDAAQTIIEPDKSYTMDVKKEKITSEITGVKSVTGISLNKDEGILNVGETEKLIATVEPTDATDKEITWTSSNNDVATVNDGEITAIAPGETIISATAGDKIATYKLTVKASLKGFTLNISEVDLLKGQSQKLEVNLEPSNTTDIIEPEWSSDNEEVAIVENGEIKGLKKGTATITVKIGAYSQSCTVTVEEIGLNEIAINQKDFELNVNDTEKLDVIFNPANTTDDKTIEWTSSDATIVSVDADGTVKALKPGTAVITATVNDKKASVKITVKEKVLDENIETEVDKDEQNNKVEDSDTPKTSDMPIEIFVALFIISGVGLVLTLTIKKSKKR